MLNGEIEAQLYFIEYSNHFNEYYQLLLDRYERFCELRESEEWSLDLDTYFEMIIVQLRALLLERGSNVVTGNYTIKNILSLSEDTEAWNVVEKTLNEVMISGNGIKQDCLLRDAIKIIADKSICHYDNFYREGSHSWELIQLLKKMLMDKTEKVNLDILMKCIISILRDGVELSLDS